MRELEKNMTMIRFNYQQKEQRKMKLILDLDTGIDDALAIAYAAGQTEAELIGITTSFGNVIIFGR